MTNQSKRRRVAGWGLAATVLALLVAAVAVPGWSGGTEGAEGEATGEAAPATASAGTRAPGALEEAAPLQSEEPPRPLDNVPLPPCWAELAKLDRTLSLEDFRQVLASGLPSRDRFLLTYLEERLTALVGNDPKKGLQVLSWVAGSEDGLEVMVLMEGLKKSGSVHHPKVTERLFQRAESTEGAPLVRAAAVIGLETQKRFDPAELQRLKALAMDVRDGQVAWNATRTIGRVMETDFNATGRYQAYWESLLDISRKSEDRAVRTMALEMPTYSNLVLPKDSIDTLAETMRTAGDREMREMAALRLSVTDEPARALDAYDQAFKTETDFCMRWAMFRFALRAGGAQALPLAQRMAQQEPRLQQDYAGFKQLYDEGVHDWNRIWLEMQSKLTDQHISCMDSHEGAQQ
ncbi:MAG TPA: HEAT repeat domain-containing protein [Myxococcus sp.]|nr:HEAT repeat domain-containing protein [Myxococcus sp.]